MSTKPLKPVRRLLDHAQKRFVRSRSGSVLILVIALLVLMALIGTAFMTMAHFDRASAIQHSFNTEVDLLLDGVINQVKGTVANDVYSSGQFRPAVIISSSQNQPVYYNTPMTPAAPHYWNGLGYDNGAASVMGIQAGDNWLASRVPGLQSDSAEPSASNLPLWSFITAPINGAGSYDQPYWPTIGQQPPALSARAQLFPTVYTGTGPNALVIDGQNWPAFTVGGMNYMAADADGDGIADSGLVKLLTLDGITYYAAVRIVDNCGAINPSIALTPNPFGTYQAPNSSGTAGYIPGDLSPANLDLEGMTVNPGSTYTATGWNPPADLYASLPPLNQPAGVAGQGLLYNFRFNLPAAGAQSPTPLNDNGTTRSDFLYYSYPFTYPGAAQPIYYYFDQQWLQLGRRLNNPGYIFPQTPPASPPAVSVNPRSLYQALPISESATMTKHFILVDPTVLSSSSSPSVLEMRMPNTTFYSPYTNSSSISITTGLGKFPYGYPTAPYSPNQVAQWFSQNFEYLYDFDLTRTTPPALSPTMPMRALLAPQNPVSNFAPDKFYMAATPVAPYHFGDVVTASNGYKYVCINPGTSSAPIPASDPDVNWSDPNWAWEPWTNAPTKTSVNTGTFQQLYAAYWAVMADQYIPGASGASGQWFPPYFGANANNPSGLTNPTNSTYGRMFRNPIRYNNTTPPLTNLPAGSPTPTTPVLSSQQVMMLRAALAAVNTMALRHGDAATLSEYGTNDIISRTVYLPAMLTGDSSFQAQVYGVERQPYITQVYARNDTNPQNAWMAVELYNPYPNAISLNNWVLATLNRTNPSNMTLTSIGGGNLQAAAGGLSLINPGQHIVLVSNASPPTSVVVPGNSTSSFYTCSGLTSAFGNELVLMRPRRADGTPSAASTLGNNSYAAESTTNPVDLIPIDSYDFTNLPPVAPTPASTQEWWYIRPSDPSTNKQWHFVYPGPWMLTSSASGTGGGNGNGNGNGSSTTQPPTWSGTQATTPAPHTTQLSTLGSAQSLQKVTTWADYEDTAIQMNNVDFGGPNKPTVTPTPPTQNDLPLGGFPRNGDILQVTYIGSYRLSAVTASGMPVTTIYEMNPVTADSAMATACDASDATNPLGPIVQQVTPPGSAQIMPENVGRFAPIDAGDASLATPAYPVNDFQSSPPLWRYHWATRIFDFLTVQAPQDDYLPDVDPWQNDPASASTASSLYRYPPANKPGGVLPTPVANITSGAANAGLIPPSIALPATATTEDTAPMNGLVNVNSAPWRVLAAVPWVPATQTNYRYLNAQIGIGLAIYRDGNATNPPHGPFQNLFQLGEATISTASGSPKLRDILKQSNNSYFLLSQGNLTPLNQTATSFPVNGDFQAIYNTITRVSNLVTTRSDSYTAYVLIQGWQNAETPSPHLVVQRRAAVIIDRSNVTPSNRTPGAIYVPE